MCVLIISLRSIYPTRTFFFSLSSSRHFLPLDPHGGMMMMRSNAHTLSLGVEGARMVSYFNELSRSSLDRASNKGFIRRSYTLFHARRAVWLYQDWTPTLLLPIECCRRSLHFNWDIFFFSHPLLYVIDDSSCVNQFFFFNWFLYGIVGLNCRTKSMWNNSMSKKKKINTAI